MAFLKKMAIVNIWQKYLAQKIFDAINFLTW